MTAAAVPVVGTDLSTGGDSWTHALRLARRELRGGLKGFRIFLACLLLGVALIAAVGSVSSAVQSGIAGSAREILGGDLELRLLYREAASDEQSFLAGLGTLSLAREMRAMARIGANEASTLVELKSVDDAYPLYGAVILAPEQPLATALAQRGDVWGAVAEQALVDRLQLKLGDRLQVGSLAYELRGVIEHEPDRGTGLFNLGPRLMVAGPSLAATGLLQPGSLVYSNYRLALPATANPDALTREIQERFPQAGWRIRDVSDAAPGVKRFIDRTGMFLTLVGLSALLVGGVGVGNAVRSYLEGRTRIIAILKCLGAPARLVFRLYLSLILLLSLLGIAAGLLLGAATPFVVSGVLAQRLGVDVPPGPYGLPLLTAAGFGLLTALTFSLWPLMRARDISPAALFRDLVAPTRRRLPTRDLVRLGLAAAALAGLAIVAASDRWLALWFVVGALASILVFRGAAAGIMALARAANRPGRNNPPVLRLALANLSRPGAATASVVLSLGLGLTVLVIVALVQGNIAREIDETVPRKAPSFFFIDLQPAQVAAFDALVTAQPGTSELKRVPMLRGRIVALNGGRVDATEAKPDVRWVLQGDRGITWSAGIPEGSRLMRGAWWPADYRGPLLVSMDDTIVDGLGLKLGDTITVNLLGREVTATLANTREMEWSSLTINFVMVFSPGMLESAPQTHIATVRTLPANEVALQRAVTDRFANVSAIRVKDALDAVTKMLSSVALAIRSTAAVTLLAGVLVLAGAIVAGHHRRVYEAVVLKVLGATRRTVAQGYLLEYGLLGLLTALLAGLLGTIAAYFFVTELSRAAFHFQPGAVLWTVLLSTAVTLALGFAGTWKALGAKAAPLLRNE